MTGAGSQLFKTLLIIQQYQSDERIDVVYGETLYHD